jgi:hypothetical protein
VTKMIGGGQVGALRRKLRQAGGGVAAELITGAAGRNEPWNEAWTEPCRKVEAKAGEPPRNPSPSASPPVAIQRVIFMTFSQVRSYRRPGRMVARLRDMR